MLSLRADGGTDMEIEPFEHRTQNERRFGGYQKYKNEENIKLFAKHMIGTPRKGK